MSIPNIGIRDPASVHPQSAAANHADGSADKVSERRKTLAAQWSSSSRVPILDAYDGVRTNKRGKVPRPKGRASLALDRMGLGRNAESAKMASAMIGLPESSVMVRPSSGAPTLDGGRLRSCDGNVNVSEFRNISSRCAKHGYRGSFDVLTNPSFSPAIPLQLSPCHRCLQPDHISPPVCLGTS